MLKYLKLALEMLRKSIYKDEITYWEIKSYVNRHYPKAQLEITDIIKMSCPYLVMRSFLKLIPPFAKYYHSEVFDCEDFSRRFGVGADIKCLI